MNKIYILLVLTTLTFLTAQVCLSQTRITKSKNCGNCGKSVSISSKIGDRCPYCGVVWGSENSHTTTSKITYSAISHVKKNQKKISTNSTIRKKRPSLSVISNDNSTASKLDTEDWILIKLSANTPKRYYETITDDGNFIYRGFGSYNMNYDYAFDDFNLRIDYEKESEINQKITKFKIEIPIYDIDRVYEFKGGLRITTKKESMIEYNLTNDTKKVKKTFTTNFETHSETELCVRLNKAFTHLKKFYKKEISRETF